MSTQVGTADAHGDVTHANSVAREVIDRIADRWVLLVISALGDGTLRYSQLRTRIDGISHKMLTRTLRNLERDGLIARHVHPTSPPQVDYTLTPPGRTLLRTVSGICHWTRDHLDHIETARRAYDAKLS
ncbi:winged helix-turn-helix transcriptional regulator [Actinosynnema sp. CS-041913]|uniref:winged helix-turn-helix transcriptional regulator n=1 Tax=Actinosynnema sp. CS-041913 TaxID=3239917 RepID=UPI003D8EF756